MSTTILVLGALLQDDDDARPQQRCQCVAGVFVGALHYTTHTHTHTQASARDVIAWDSACTRSRRAGVNKATLYPSATCPLAAGRRLWRKRTFIYYYCERVHRGGSDSLPRIGRTEEEEAHSKNSSKKITRSRRSTATSASSVYIPIIFDYNILYSVRSEFVRRATHARADNTF